MKKHTLAIAALALAAGCAETESAAQPVRSDFDSRYDRALAAGYKALMLCSAIANAELNGAERTPESVHEWELSGIQAPLDAIIRDMPYQIVRADADRLPNLIREVAEARGTSVEKALADVDPALLEADNGRLRHVLVEWAEDMPPRIAQHSSTNGCNTLPIGWDTERLDPALDVLPVPPFVEPLTDFGTPSDPSLAPAADAFDGSTYGEGRTTAVLVMRGGSLVFEDYADGFGPSTPQRTWSVAKSIAATMVGVSVQRGTVSVDQPLRTSLTPAAGDPRNAVTVDHLLRMASGRYSDTPGNRTDPIYWGGATVDERAANWPLIHPPGTVFRYANNDTLMAIEAIEEDLEENPPSDFFAKLGMNHTIAETDWQGNYVLSSQVWSTARDLARLGQLHAQDGVWNGERLLPEGWVDYISDPSGPQRSETNWGYGAGWWTFHRNDGLGYDGIPEDAFAAQGNRGQYVVVVPSRKIVIVRRGEDMVGTRFDIVAFTRDVLAALDGVTVEYSEADPVAAATAREVLNLDVRDQLEK